MSEKVETPRTILQRFVLALAALVINGILAVVLIASSAGMERLVMYLWGTDSHSLFGRIPLSYLFNFMDFAVLVVFMFSAIAQMYGVMRGRTDDRD